MDNDSLSPSIAIIDNLHVAFQSKNSHLPAVDNLSFCLKAGETLALLGESGCGKSITALALMRLLPINGVYGQQSKVKLAEQDLLLLPESLMRELRGKRIAMIFQEPMTALNPVLTIGQQLAETIPGYKKLPRSTLKEKLVNLLEKVEMSEPQLRLQQYPHQLSGGQKQRIVIAMAIANEPDILIADEPTTALDVTIQAQILQLLKKLQTQHKMSMLLITHDLGVVRAVADRVCVMYAGQLVEQAQVNEFFNNVKHPYTQQLLAAVPLFEKRNEKLPAIKGIVPSLESLPAGCRFHPRCNYAFARCTQIMPNLQTINNHQIRCHLYPENLILPSLELSHSYWPKKENLPAELLLEVSNLRVEFKTKKHLLDRHPHIFTAVDDLSLKLYRGKTVALVGESGCGKTTASRALLHLIPITSGDLYFKGKNVIDLNRKSLKNYRKKVQIIFQDPYSSMNPRMMVGDILAEGMVAHGMKANEIKKNQLKLLEQVNLPQTSLSKYPHQFSGGQRQRISIARALATEPEVLICDEPTSALDVSVQAQILNLLKELQINSSIAYLFITHNMAVVSYLADEVLVMQKGHILESGTCGQIFTSPKHEYTRQLLGSVLTL